MQVAGQWRGDTALTLPLFWRRSTVSPVFFGRFPRSSLHSVVPFPLCPSPPTKPSRFRGRKATKKKNEEVGVRNQFGQSLEEGAGKRCSECVSKLKRRNVGVTAEGMRLFCLHSKISFSVAFMQPSYLLLLFFGLFGWLVGCCCFGGCLFCSRFCLVFFWGGGGRGLVLVFWGEGGSCCFNLWCILVLFVAGFGTARLARGERRTVLVPGPLLQVCDPMQPRPVRNRNYYPERTRTCSSTLPQLPPPAPPHARQVVWCVDHRRPVDTHRIAANQSPCFSAFRRKCESSVSLCVSFQVDNTYRSLQMGTKVR